MAKAARQHAERRCESDLGTRIDASLMRLQGLEPWTYGLKVWRVLFTPLRGATNHRDFVAPWSAWCSLRSVSVALQLSVH
jgi:hypothetical protein